MKYPFAHVDEFIAAGGVGAVFGTGAGNQTYITTDGGQFKTLPRRMSRSSSATARAYVDRQIGAPKTQVMKRYFPVSVAVALFSCSPSDADHVDRAAHGSGEWDLASATALGLSCTSDSVCGTGQMCAAGRCACAPGFVACGAQCVDLTRDAQHCGACDTKCSGASGCVGGVCGGSARLLTGPAAPIVGSPVEIDGASAATSCVQVNEAYPERPVTYGASDLLIPFQTRASIFPSSTPTPYNWRNRSTSSWASPSQWIPYSGSIGQVHSDNWATSSGGTGLEYVSTIFTGPSGGCIGIAATSATNLATSPPTAPNWAFPLTCATASHPHVPDGPSIHYDIGGSSLFAVEHDSSTGRAVLHVYRSCGYGQPGVTGGGCPETNTVNLPLFPQGHATVTVNPCTHDAIVAYRDNASKGIVLAFYDEFGTAKGTYLSAAAPRGETSACSTSSCNGVDNGQRGAVPICGGSCSLPADCTGTISAGRGCARLTDKVHVATKYDSGSGKCFAHIAYDSNYSDAGQTYMRANFDIVNITNESSPTVVKQYATTPDIWFPSDHVNAFSSISTANEFTSGVGWFFYANVDPCSTYFVGGTSTTLGTAGLDYFIVDGPFPTMRFDEGFGLGDYIGIVKRGLPGGDLFPTWARPVASSGSGAACVSCQSTRYSLGVFGATVTP